MQTRKRSGAVRKSGSREASKRSARAPSRRASRVDTNTLPVPTNDPEVSTERAKLLAEYAKVLSIVSLAPTINAAEIVTRFVGSDVKLDEVAGELQKQCDAVQSGKTGRLEATLVSQAHSLDVLFNRLAQRAALNMGTHLGAAETYMKLALRAQSQCRATLETLSVIKNPPVVFAKQANIAHGPQQVNNALTRAENETEQPKLLEQEHGEWLDTGATRQAIGSDPPVAAVATVDRTPHVRRKVARKPQ